MSAALSFVDPVRVSVLSAAIKALALILTIVFPILSDTRDRSISHESVLCPSARVAAIDEQAEPIAPHVEMLTLT